VTATRSSKIPVGLVAGIRALGLSPRDVLVNAELPSHLFDFPAARVPVEQYFALWHAIGRVSKNPGIGIALGRAVEPDLTEPLFLAVMSAYDLGSALDVLSRYKRALCPEELVLQIDEAAEQITFVYRWPGAATVPQTLVDAELAFIVERCRRGTRHPEFVPREIHLAVDTLDPAGGHAEFFRCPIRLGAPEAAVVFAATDLARRFVTFNPELLHVLLPHLQAQSPAVPQSAINRVRSAIVERLHGRRPTVEAVARELAMSRRALQRLLGEHGTTFRELLDDERNQRARAYLGSTTLSDAEVAFLLGFEDPNSFYRAFRSWNDMSPSEFRLRPYGQSRSS